VRGLDVEWVGWVIWGSAARRETRKGDAVTVENLEEILSPGKHENQREGADPVISSNRFPNA